MRPGLDGWRSTHGRGPGGAVYSDEGVHAARPAVAHSEAGALELGDRYWREIARASRGIVRRHDGGDEVELRLFGLGPLLLRFGRAELSVDGFGIRCRYSIRGGLLARRASGAITLSQTNGAHPELRAVVTGFVPRLAPGPVYEVERRIHVAISRGYFLSLMGARP